MESPERHEPKANESSGKSVPAAFLDTGWEELSAKLPPSTTFPSLWDDTRRKIEAAAEPELSFSTWSRWVDEGLRTGDLARRSERWGQSSEFRAGFLTVAGASPALGAFLLTSWESFEPDRWQLGWESKDSLSRRLSIAAVDATDREFPDAIRRFQKLELLRIAYLDLVESLPVDRVTVQISTLADVLIESCLSRALAQVATRRKLQAPPGGFVVMALGKLGGHELNYSSDVDLNFVYDTVSSDPVAATQKEFSDPLELERLFTQVAERLIELVTAFTDQGQLYRLDTRLRPQGSSGRLVTSLRATVEYYYSVGRAWERQALIRMRPVAGDRELGARLRRELDPFVFPRNLSAQEIAEIRGLKLQMEKASEERGPSEEQIKIGRGGIRDVEYIVQYLQLIQASSVPALKRANVFQALELLESEGLLKPEETDVLRRGYRFLRKVEHRIQMAQLRQTHRLPEDPAELLRLARSLGFATIETFRGSLARHAAGIRRVYRLLFEEATAPKRDDAYFPALLDMPLELAAADGARFLSVFGFRDPEAAFARLRALAGGSSDRLLLDAHRAQRVFGGLVVRLLREVSRLPEPDRALSNFEECVRTLGARSVFYQLLSESERTLQLFVEICARSTLVVERLRANPELFDELVDALATGYSFHRESLLAEVERLCRESPDFAKELAKFKQLHLLLIAIRDLEELDNLSTTLLRIAELNEALLHAVLLRGLQETESRFGAWVGSPPRFLVLGLGKLGGQEMNYKSDVDIVLLYEGRGQTTSGITTQEYFERLSQSALREAGVADSFGPVLKVDLRLRPLGGHNSLAISVEAWKQYFLAGQACTWERQAFLRGRPVAGDPTLAEEVLRFIHGELVVGGSAGPPSAEQALRDVREMRSKIEGHAKAGDLKRGAGGIVDVEFIVQALQLVHGKAHPEVLTPNTAAGIDRLLRAGIFDASQGSALLTSYQFLRWIENRVTLVAEAGQSIASLDSAELESLVQKIGYKSTGEESALSIFQSELDYHRKVNRRELLRVLGSEPSGG